MRSYRSKKILTAAFLSLVAVACEKDDKAKTDEDSDTGGVKSTGGGSTVVADDLGDLKLTDAFTISLPGALEGEAAAALNLLEEKRSQEACQMGETIKEVTRSLMEVGGFFCHMEVEKDLLKFGKKYKITTNGEEFAKIYVDDSEKASGKITVGFCSSQGGHSNSQLIQIDAITEVGPKGSIISSGSGSFEGVSQSWKSATTFDMSVSGIASLVAEQLHSSDANEFRRKVELALKDAGVSTATLAAKGSWGGQSFLERGAAKFDGTFGSALFQNQGSYQGSDYSFSRRAYFNEAGAVVTAADVSSSVIPEVTDVPNFLADDFEPSAATGWVGSGCPDFDEVIELNPDSDAHKACESGRDDNHGDCWDQTKYQSGENSTELD